MVNVCKNIRMNQFFYDSGALLISMMIVFWKTVCSETLRNDSEKEALQ